MWMNGIEYELVEKGSIETTAVLCLFLGALIVGMLLLLYTVGKRNMFRKYYRQINDENMRKEIVGKIKSIADDVDELANKTNTLFFRTMANEFNSLMAELRRRV
jgi:hypothetical protein